MVSEFPGALNVGDGQAHRDHLGRDNGAAAVFDEQIGDEVLVCVPPFGFLSFGAEARGVYGHFSSFHSLFLRFFLAV